MRQTGSSNQTAGLTLIEVLIALAIVGIALTAIIKATSHNIRSTNYLQNKTFTMWAGQNVLNEVRVGVLVLQGGEEKQSKTTLLGRDYYWTAVSEETPNRRIKKVTVNVYEHDQHAEDETPVISMDTYIYGGANE